MKRKQPPFHIRLLSTELARRKSKNSQYSMRAFASFLEMHSSALSRVLNVKQDLSLQSSELVIRKLCLPLEQARLFIASVAEDKRNRASAVLSRAIGAPESVDQDIEPRFEKITSPAAQDPITATSVLNFSDDLVSVVDMEGRFLYVNENTAAKIDAVPCDFIGLKWSETNYPVLTAKELEDQQWQVCRSGQPMEFFFAIADDKVLREYRRSIVPLRDAKGVVTSYASTIRDVTLPSHVLKAIHLFHESVTDLELTLNRVAHSPVPLLADTALVMLESDKGRMLQVAASEKVREEHTLEPARAQMPAPHRSVWELTERELWAFSDMNPKNIHVAPLKLTNGRSGALVLVHSAAKRELNIDERAAISELSRAASLSISNAILFAG